MCIRVGSVLNFGADSQAVIDIHSHPQKLEALGWLDGMLKTEFYLFRRLSQRCFIVSRETCSQGSTGNGQKIFFLIFPRISCLDDAQVFGRDADEIGEKPVSTDQEFLENRALPGEGYWYAFGRLSYLEPFFEIGIEIGGA